MFSITIAQPRRIILIDLGFSPEIDDRDGMAYLQTNIEKPLSSSPRSRRVMSDNCQIIVIYTKFGWVCFRNCLSLFFLFHSYSMFVVACFWVVKNIVVISCDKRRRDREKEIKLNVNVILNSLIKMNTQKTRVQRWQGKNILLISNKPMTQWEVCMNH